MTRDSLPPRAPRVLHVMNVQFLREQDGEPEQLMKSRLADFFKRYSDVQRAYLSQIRTKDHISVALCLKSVGDPNQNLVNEIGKIFATIFGSREYLDILFLSAIQESELKVVCTPFFALSTM